MRGGVVAGTGLVRKKEKDFFKGGVRRQYIVRSGRGRKERDFFGYC